jgi:DNA-binding NarL/FixJ family response regulator
MQRIRVLVEASDPISLAGVLTHLQSQPELSVVSSRDASEAEVLLLCVESVNAEVMSRLRLSSSSSQTKTVLVARDLRQEEVLSLVECRVVAVIPRQYATPERLGRVIVGARSGHGTLPADLLGSLLHQVEELQRVALAPLGLTPAGLAKRELDVLRLVADGFDTAEIAMKLSYSERTVKNILYGVLSRLRVRNRSHAVAAAIRAGVI